MTDLQADPMTRETLIAAAKQADWMQVVLNQGPPCFHVEGEKFCLCAERWPGHDSLHAFVPLDVLLRKVAKLK